MQASLDETTEESVVFCQSANEFETADRERKARGKNNITFVVLDKNGEEEILIEGTKGTSVQSVEVELWRRSRKHGGMRMALMMWTSKPHRESPGKFSGRR